MSNVQTARNLADLMGLAADASDPAAVAPPDSLLPNPGGGIEAAPVVPVPWTAADPVAPAGLTALAVRPASLAPDHADPAAPATVASAGGGAPAAAAAGTISILADDRPAGSPAAPAQGQALALVPAAAPEDRVPAVVLPTAATASGPAGPLAPVSAGPAASSPASGASTAVEAAPLAPAAAAPATDGPGASEAEAPGAASLLGGVTTGEEGGTEAAVTDDKSDHALQADTARSTYGIDGSTTSTGTTIRIGILSDSFNAKGGAATDEGDGDLPSADKVHILKDYSGGSDEGRSMAELVHRIAPGAEIDFYTATGGQAAFATGIQQLAAAGCQIIIDDYSYFAEPFYQAGGTVQQAVDQVVAQGVTYFTSVTNNGHQYYENNWNNIAGYTLPGISGTQNVNDVGNGTPYETFTMKANSYAYFDTQWAAAFKSLGGAGSTYTIGAAIYDMQSGTPVLKGTLSPTALGGDPTNVNYFTNNSSDTQFAIAYYQVAGAVPSGAFKTIIINTNNATFTGLGSGTGSGATYGHNGAVEANPTAAVYYGNTPANGGTLSNESFSSEGGQTLYYDAAGNMLATPLTLTNPVFSATDGDATSVLNPFYGTSAAAPNAGAVAALVLAEDGRLVNKQVSYLLGATATAFGNDLYSGDGLVNANAAVGAAHTAVTTPIWTGLAGSTSWTDAANWSDGAAPTAGQDVTLGNGIGLLTAAYTVLETLATVSLDALTIDGAGPALYALSATAAPVLDVAASSVLTAASLALGLGTLDLDGRVNSTTSFSATTTAASLLTGSGKLILSGGSNQLAGLTVGGSVLLRDTSAVTQTGAVVLGDASGGAAQITVAPGGTWTIAGDVGIAAGGAQAVFSNGGTLDKSAGIGTSTIGVQVVNNSGVAGTIEVDSGALDFTGVGNTFAGQTVTGGGTFELSGGGTAALGAGTAMTVSNTVVTDAGTVLSLAASVNDSGFFQLRSGATIALGTATLTLTGGLFTDAGGGTPTVTGGSGGKLILGGSSILNGLTLGGGALLRNTGTVQDGAVTVGTASGGAAQVTNAAGATWVLSYGGGIAAGNAAAVFNNGGGTLTKTSDMATCTVATGFTNISGTVGAIQIAGGGILFTGASNDFSNETVSGSGLFTVGGGSSVIGSGTTLTANGFTLAGDGTMLALNGALSFANAFTDAGGTTLALGSNTLTLSGAASFAGVGAGMPPVITGAGKLLASGTTTIAGLTIGGSTLFRDTGTVTQTGAVTLGDSSGGAAQITVAGGAKWQIAGDVGLAAGASAAVINLGGGILVKTAGAAARSVVAPNIVNQSTTQGTIRAASGKLELAGTVTGNVALKANAGTTLLLDKAASSQTAFSYTGAGATLQLNDAQDFAGSISGFASGESLDLRSIAYGSGGPSVGYADAGNGSGTLTVADGTHVASLKLLGSYSTANFAAASDGHGGTLFAMA